MEYRIEQLARVAGVAVDTIRFYQGKGLLTPPRRQGRVTWYNREHLERLRRIRSLQQRGFSLTVIRRFLEGELQPSDERLIEAITAPTKKQILTLPELAARTGIPEAFLKALEQLDLLIPLGQGDEAHYQEADVAALSAGMNLLVAGVPVDDLIELGREQGACLQQVARKAVQLFDRHVRERIQAEGRPQSEESDTLLGLFSELLEASSNLVRYQFERILLRAAREHVERNP